MGHCAVASSKVDAMGAITSSACGARAGFESSKAADDEVEVREGAAELPRDEQALDEFEGPDNPKPMLKQASTIVSNSTLGPVPPTPDIVAG